MLSKGKAKKKPKKFEQVLGRAHRKCGEWMAHFFFLGSEPGTGARPSLQKMWRVDRTFFFFFGWRSGPGTGALWRVDRTFLFLGGLNLEHVLGRA